MVAITATQGFGLRSYDSGVPQMGTFYPRGNCVPFWCLTFWMRDSARQQDVLGFFDVHPEGHIGQSRPLQYASIKVPKFYRTYDST